MRQLAVLALLAFCVTGCGTNIETDVASMKAVIENSGFRTDNVEMFMSDEITGLNQRHYYRPGKTADLILLSNWFGNSGNETMFALIADTDSGRNELTAIAEKISPKLSKLCQQCLREAGETGSASSKLLGNLEVIAKGNQLLIQTIPAPQLTIRGLKALWKTRAREDHERSGAGEGGKVPKEFAGHFQTGILVLFGSGFHGVPIFMDPNRPAVIPAADCVVSDSILKDICAAGAAIRRVIRKVPGVARLAAPNYQYKDMLHIAVFTPKNIPITEEVEFPLYFKPGAVTKLKDIIKRYGSPTEKELWTLKELQALVGLNGTVYWWGDIGIAASLDSTITHILVRERETKKE